MSLHHHVFRLFLAACLMGSATAAADPPPAPEAVTPVVAGEGPHRFTVGQPLYQTNFSDPENWVVQMQANPDSPLTPQIEFGEGVMDLYAPQRGCTAWVKQPFKGPIAVIYRVRCPVETQDDPGILVRDVNNFWHASDPTLVQSVLDPERFTGDFGDYSHMQGYYASAGGRRNSTTRLRRYPHENREGQSLQHIALTHQDKKPRFLLTPGRWHTVQLVAFDDLIQFYFDEQLAYEMSAGDQVRIEHRPDEQTGVYDTKRFPAYTQGHVGLRMVGTHHQYKDFAVYRLDPAAP